MSQLPQKACSNLNAPTCLCRSLPTGGMWREESPKTWLLQGSWARFHSPWCRAWHEYCWWCNDLSIGKTDFFSFSALWNTLRLATMQTIIEIFLLCLKKIKTNNNNNKKWTCKIPVCEKRSYLKKSILQKPFFDTTAQYTNTMSLIHTHTLKFQFNKEAHLS